MSDIPFHRDLAFDYGRVDQLSPLIRRVIARNPSPFTFHGTGTYIIGHGDVAVIDPGPDLPDHRQALLDCLDGERVSHILITHTHDDHSGGARAFQAAVDAPTYGFAAHPSSHEQDQVEAGADEAFTPDHRLAEGDVLAGAGWRLETLHTPGHLSNHLCFALPAEAALFTGDHVMGWSTSVIVPPNGHMGDYIRNMERLLDRPDRIYYPTHGAPIAEPQPFVRALIRHRREREANILACFGENITTVTAIVERLYRDVPRHLHAAAAQSVQAHLIHLQEQGRIGLDDQNRLRLRTTQAG
ncbi:MAG TPA: MBL fold metallo-hydrolase [Dongiaceae bacterium]|nr:MBL fold metallo-hydrolase [Dongiaceae bacterium]